MEEKKTSFWDKYKKQLEEAKKDLTTPGKRHRQIPNILTSLRLLAPCIIIPAAITGNALLTMGLAATFGLTDLADGYIARKYKLTSDLGAALDAVTDKVFVGTLLIAAAITNPFLITNIALEGVIAGININAALKGKDTHSSQVGKIKTWALFALAGVGIASYGLSIPGLLPTLAIGTGLLQGMTIHSYIDQYKVEEDATSSKKEESTPTSYLTEPEQATESSKEKTKEYEAPSVSTLDDLKAMSDFLHEESKNQQAPQANQAPPHQKVKKD